MSNNLNHFLNKAEEFIAKADAIRNAVAVLAPFANDNEIGDVPPPVMPVAEATVSIEVEPPVEAANDNAATPPPPSSAAAAPGKGGRSKLADSNLIDALTRRNQKPAQMVETLATMGIKVSKGLIYQRMPKLADALPDLIVAEGKAWRIKSKAAPDTSAKAVKTAASAAAPRKGAVGKAKAVMVDHEAPAPIKTKMKPRRSPTKKKSNGNYFATASSRIESLLTDEFKDVPTIHDECGAFGWAYSLTTVQRVCDCLVSLGVADVTPIGGADHYARA